MTEQLRGGRNIYGEIIGVIMTERRFPRIPGDMGNATTFKFPVRFRVVKGHDVNARWRVLAGDRQFVDPFIQAAKELEVEGVRAITSNCGFLILYQDDLADAVHVPVFASPLLQIPIVHRMLKKDQKVAVLTADASPQGVGRKHIEAAGAGHLPVVIMGMEKSEGFKPYIEDGDILFPEKARADLIDAAKTLTRQNPDIGAFVLECGNMPAYSKSIQEAVNLPVFDALTLVNFVYSAVVKEEIRGCM